jgi:hypothetical protein
VPISVDGSSCCSCGSIEVEEGLEGVNFRSKPSGFAGLADLVVLVSSGRSGDDLGTDDLDDVGLGELAARDFSGAEAVDGLSNRSTLRFWRVGNVDCLGVGDRGQSRPDSCDGGVVVSFQGRWQRNSQATFE